MKYFGTDGIRGYIDDGLDSNLAYKVGCGVAGFIYAHNLPRKVIIGKDTRISGDMLVFSITSALLNYGIDVCYIGIVPTACVSYLSSKTEVGIGIMVTASHNTYDMNGIKIINNLGYKLPISDEEEIEKFIDDIPKIDGNKKGSFYEDKNLVEIYKESILEANKVDLCGFNIAIDCANGSNYQIALDVFKKLHANIVPIAYANDGLNINNECGAQHVENLQREVLNHKCDIGFAFDGDADRLRVVLNDGTILDGDDILFVFANYMKIKNRLNSLSVVGTIMTNVGTEKSLNKCGISLKRVQVGDRNVIELMKNEHFSIGGETSGHICMHDYNTTCDALFNAVYFMNIVVNGKVSIQDLLLRIKKEPQTIKNIKVSKSFRGEYNTNINFLNELQALEEKHKNDSRIVVRPSGTEPVFRIMVESDSVEHNNIIINEIIDLFDKHNKTN